MVASWPVCRICGLSSPDITAEGLCPDVARCRRVMSGEPLSETKGDRYSDVQKIDFDLLPDPPLTVAAPMKNGRAGPEVPVLLVIEAS